MLEKNNITISDKCTVYLSFTSVMPKLFIIVNNDNGVPEYFRYMDGKTPRIKFNMPVPGSYNANVDFSIVKIVPIEIPTNLPMLPPAERDRLQGEPTIVYDPNWTISPASTFTTENIIVHGPVWKSLIPPVRLFIDLHEMGHFFYVSEEKCDLYAFINFLRMGYNRSTAYYTLSNVLRRSAQQVQRVKSIFQIIQKTTGEFSPQ